METVIAIGELLWDCYKNRRNAAGAPYNFARHLKICGQNPYFISSVGSDPDGDALKAEFEKAGIDGLILKSNKFPTGYARIIVEEGRNHFELGNPAAWDDISLTSEQQSKLRSFGYICYGSLAQRFDLSRSTIHQLVEPPSFKRIFDINLRPPFDDFDATMTNLVWNLEHCDILKMSDEDMTILKTFPVFSEVDDMIAYLFGHTPIEVILETLGDAGARYHDRTGKTLFCAAPKVNVVSTVGAGDAFLAAFISSMISGKLPEESLKDAVEYAARVVSTPAV